MLGRRRQRTAENRCRATAVAAATLRESTPGAMGTRTCRAMLRAAGLSPGLPPPPRARPPSLELTRHILDALGPRRGSQGQHGIAGMPKGARDAGHGVSRANGTLSTWPSETRTLRR